MAILKPKLNPVRHIELWLWKEDTRLQTYCIICRERLVGIHQRIVVIAPEGMGKLKFLSPPIEHTCPKCGTVYHIKNVI